MKQSAILVLVLLIPFVISAQVAI